MNKIALSAILVFSILKLGAQTVFEPYKLDNIEWMETQAVSQSGGSSQWNDYYYNFYKLCGDTVYNSKTYKKVYYGYVYNQYQPLPPWLIPQSAPSYSLHCFFRQDSLTKSNYYCQPGWSADSLLVSYNINVGDTIKQGMYSNTGSTGVYWKVQKRDSIFYSGRKLNIFYTDTTTVTGGQYCGNPFTGMFLVEGLGHCFGIFYGYVIPFENWNTEDSISFSATCGVVSVPFNSSGYSDYMKVSPNPCNGILCVETNDEDKRLLEITSTNGKKVFSKWITGSVKLNLVEMPDGLYNMNILYGNSIQSKRIIIAK